MNVFCPGMKLLNYFVSTNCRNCMLNRCRTNVSKNINNEPLVGLPLRILIPNIARNFMVYVPLLRKKVEAFNEFNSNKAPGRTTSIKVQKVSVIDENNVELVMTYPEAEGLAKRKRLKLIQLERSGTDKIKYKLENLFTNVVEPKTRKKNNLKKIIFREETQTHDLNLKINQMIKFIEKGRYVLCVLEGAGNKERQEEILKLLNESALKDSFISKIGTKRGFHIQYGPQSEEKQDVLNKEKNQTIASSK